MCSEIQRHFFLENLDGRAVDLRVLQAADLAQLIDAGYGKAHALQGLTQLETDGAQSHDGHLSRQIFLFKDRVGGQQVVSEIRPPAGDHRSGSGGDHDAAGMKCQRADPEHRRLDKLGLSFYKPVAQRFDNIFNNAAHKSVAKRSHVSHGLGDIDAEALRPVDSLVAENLPPVVVVTDLDHDL